MNSKRGCFIGLLSIVIVIGYSCQDLPSNSVDSGQEQAIYSQHKGNQNHPAIDRVQRNFRASLKAEEEVHEVDSNAQGQAIFQVSKDGDSIHFKLIVANIENVIMAHIHLAPVGENGPVVVWLYPDAPPPLLIEGRSQGVLAEGTITADDIDGEHFEGVPLDELLDELIKEMKSGNTYVNVHTEQYPPGEIRGQIR